MFDVQRLLGQMLGGGVSKSKRGRSDSFGSSIGAGLGSVNGGIGGGLSKGALGVGALGIAWAAFEHFKEKGAETAAAASPALPAAAMPPPFMGNPGLPAPAPAQIAPAEPAAALMPAQSSAQNATLIQREADAAHLIRAMISAANADGQIDMHERSQILERAMSAGLSPETQKFLLAELGAPAALAQIISATREGLQREVYAASMLAITADTIAEQAHLNSLALALKLDDAALAQISAAIGPR